MRAWIRGALHREPLDADTLRPSAFSFPQGVKCIGNCCISLLALKQNPPKKMHGGLFFIVSSRFPFGVGLFFFDTNEQLNAVRVAPPLASRPSVCIT